MNDDAQSSQDGTSAHRDTASTGNPRLSTPIVIRSPSAGPMCPRCASEYIEPRSLQWKRFMIYLVVFIVVEGIAQLAGSESDEGGLIEGLLDLAGIGCFGIMVWAFFAALFGKNRCVACGYKWSKD